MIVLDTSVIIDLFIDGDAADATYGSMNETSVFASHRLVDRGRMHR